MVCFLDLVCDEVRQVSLENGQIAIAHQPPCFRVRANQECGANYSRRDPIQVETLEKPVVEQV